MRTGTAERRDDPALGVKLRAGVARALEWLFWLRGSPEAIARGVALGTFISVTPTLGVQVWLAAILATLLNANRPAAVAMVFLTNPLTAAPIFLVTYRVGLLLYDGPPASTALAALEVAVANIGTLDPRTLVDSVRALGAIGREIMIPTSIGGVIVGAALALPAYAVTLVLVRRARARREARAQWRRRFRERRAKRRKRNR